MNQLSTALHGFRELKRLAPSVLARLLAPYEPELRAAGLEIPGLGAAELWNAREYLPVSLVDTVHDIYLMSDSVAHEQLMMVANREGYDPPVMAYTVEIATAMFLDRRALFHEAVARRSVDVTQPFYELVGRDVVVPTYADGVIRAITAELRDYYQRNDLGDHCEIETWQDGDLHYFLVVRPDRRQVGREMQARRFVTKESCPATYDLVILDTRTGRLRIRARGLAVRTQYAQGFGRFLFGHERWFAPGPVVSLEPLLTSPRRALAPTGGILEARVAVLHVDHRGPHGCDIRYSGPDVMGTLQDLRLHPRRHGPLRGATLRLRHASDGEWRSVMVRPPDRLTSDWRSHDRVARLFLEMGGFVMGPPSGLVRSAG